MIIKFFKYIFHLISRCIFWIIPVEIREILLQKELPMESLLNENSTKECYEHFKEIINDGTPIVMFDRTSDEVDCDKVIVDDFDSARNATQHLIDLGCKKVALFSSIDKYKASEKEEYI